MALIFKAFCLVTALLFLFVSPTFSMSNSFGHNPQHEFGEALNTRLSTLLPFWTLTGHAFANEDFVRITEDRQKKRGGLWNTTPLVFESFEIIFKFRVSGVGKFGADGFGFWIVEEKGQQGDLYGFNPTFSGLGIAIDTYDNENTGDHPLLIAIVNDGTEAYHHSHAHGAHSEKRRHEVGTCKLHNIRNLENPSLMRVVYDASTLTIEVDLYGDGKYRECVKENIHLGKARKYMGFTATTGDLADNHDIYGLSFRNLAPNAEAIDSQRAFATFDRYSTTDILSNIRFDIGQLNNRMEYQTKVLKNSLANVPPPAVPAGAPPASGENTARIIDMINRLQASNDGLASSLGAITATVNRIANQGTGGGSGGSGGSPIDPAIPRDIGSILSAVQSTKSQLRMMADDIAKLRSQASASAAGAGVGDAPYLQTECEGTSIFVYIFIFLLISSNAYFVFSLYKEKRERTKKLF